MAEAQEDTVGQTPQEKEASPVKKDVLKTNGELPDSEQIAEIVGKKKEDPTLSNAADGPAAAENGESAIPTEEGTAKDTDGPSPAPQESSSPSEEVTESAEADEEPPTGLDVEQGIEESFLSLVDSGKEGQDEDQTSPDVLEAEGETFKSGETEKELASEGLPTADEPLVAKPAENTEQAEQTAEEAKENPEIVGQNEQEVEETRESADIPETNEPIAAREEGTANPVVSTETDEPKTGDETRDLVDTTLTDDPETHVGEAEAHAGEPKALVGVEEETTPKSEETTEEEAPKIEETAEADEQSGAEFAEEEIPKTDVPNAPEVAVEEIPKSVETTETDEPDAPEIAAKEIPKADEPSITEVAAEEIPKADEPSITEVAAEEIPKADEPSVSEVAAEEIPKADETSVSEVAAEEIPKIVDTTETDEQSVPEVAAEEAHKNFETTETGEQSVQEVAAEETPKTLATTETDEHIVTEVAAEEIPKTIETTDTDEPSEPEVAVEKIPKSLETTETDEPNVPEVAAGKIPKIDALEPQIAEEEKPKPSEVDEPKVAEAVVDEDKEHAGDNTDRAEEPKAEVLSKAEDFASHAGESTPAVEEVGEPAKVEEGVPEEEVLVTPSPSPVKQEAPAFEAEKRAMPKSFFGVVLKPVGSNGKSFEIQPKQEDSEKDPEAPSALSQEKEAGPTEVEEVPGVAMESENVPKEVSPGSSENATTETPESVEQDNVDDSSKEAGIPTSAVEEKEIPQAEVSTDVPASTPEDASTEPSSTNVADEAPEEKEVSKVEQSTETPITAAEDTTDRLTEETSKGAEAEEGTSLPVEDAVEEKPAGEDGSPLKKQPSLSINTPKQGEATAAEGETPEEYGLTTPRGTPLMQRVEQLEQKLGQLEGRQSPRSDFVSTGQSTPRSSIDSRPIKHSTRFVLEETGSKGTLLDRVAALEQKLAFINLHPPSPINGQLSPPVATVSKDASTKPDSKPVQTQTRQWSPSEAEGEKAPEQTNFEEASKAAEDPVKPNTEEKLPQKVVPAQTKPMAPVRNNSLTERKIKAKAVVGKVTGMLTGCFVPKKTGTHTEAS